MVQLRSLAGIIAVVSATPCSAFLVPGPKQAGVRGAPASFPASAATAPGLLRSSSSSSSSSTKIDAGKSRLPLSFSIDDATDAAAAAAAVASGTNARRLSGPGRQTAAAGPLKAVAGAGEEPGDGGKDFTSARRAVLLTVWLCFTAYAFGPWSPGATGDPADTELVVHLYDAVVPQTAVFVNVFNSVGAMAPILGSLLVGGGAVRRESQPVPPLPFVFGTFALGFISMGPYLALRNYVPEAVEAEEEMSSLEKAFTSKLFAAPLLALAVYTYYALFSALADPAAVSGFADLFGSSKLANVSTIDLTILTTAVVDPLREDMRRRGVEPEAAKVALFALPLVGPTLWMLIRPPVERG